jgi:hypothetical protein
VVLALKSEQSNHWLEENTLERRFTISTICKFLGLMAGLLSALSIEKRQQERVRGRDRKRQSNLQSLFCEGWYR